MQNKNNSITYNAAVYLRLSKEDGDIVEGSKLVSNSIGNQKELALDFLKSRPEIHVYDIYMDDGYTGVNCDRPDFQRLLKDIREGAVNCIIVKDFSRFSRNYIESGRYIEKVFPMLGVRFISIIDNYDSLRSNEYGNDMIVPFKNLVNDAYCRDISVKIRSNMQTKRKNGEYVGAFVAFGYLKDEENRNKIVVDEYAAEVVRDIFVMKLCGMNEQAIAEKLNADGILAPLDYKRSIGINLKTSFQKQINAGWSYNAVRRILKNDIYLGNLAQGKTTTPNYKVKKRIQKDASEWVRKENTHEAIITESEFSLVQQLMNRDTRVAPVANELYPFSGLIYCGDCREPMVRKTVPSGKQKYVYYVCSGNKKDKGKCSPHRIAEKQLQEVILTMLQVHIEHVLAVDAALQAIESIPYSRTNVLKYEERIVKKRKELEKAEKRKLHLYEDYKDGILSLEEFQMLKADYSRQIVEAESAIQTYEQEKAAILDNRSSQQEWIEMFRKNRGIQKLERNAVVFMINRITIYDATHVEIEYRFQDKLAAMQEYVASFSEEERRAV